MSNFLKNVVRRGAGLPLPISIRPAIGPQQIPPSLVSSQYSGENDPDLRGAEPARPPEPLTTTIRTTESGGPHASLSEKPSSDLIGVVAKQSPDRLATPKLAPLSSAATFEVAPISPVFDTSHPEAPEDAPHLTTKVHPTQAIRETVAPYPPRSGNTGEIQKQILHVAPAKPASHGTPPNLANTMRPAIEREQPPLLRASEPGSTRQTTASKSAPPENRNIQVKIGRVEIRSSQPPQVVRPTRPANTGGFDDFKLSRNYLDRNRC